MIDLRAACSALLLLLVAMCIDAVAASEQDPCMIALQHIQSGQFAHAEQALGLCDRLGDIEEAVNQMKRKLNDVTQKLAQTKSKVGTTAPIEPALQWAQSPDSVFINVKFAHKLDAPACIDLVDPIIDIEESRVIVRAGCKGFDKHFKLDLVLYSSIMTANSSWSMTSVGRGSFTLLKQVVSKWDRLLASREKPKNLHVWWAMQEKYDDALSKLKSDSGKAEEAAKVVEEFTNNKSNDDGAAKEDDLSNDFQAAKKRVQEQAKRAKKDIESKASEKRSKLQKQIDVINDEETQNIGKIDDEIKSAIAKLNDKLKTLKAKREAGETVSWGDDDVSAESEEREGSFLAAIGKVLKKALGVDAPKDEV